MRRINLTALVFKTLFHQRRLHLAVVLGTALAAAILTGALVTGDSVRYSLTSLVYRRLGKTAYAIDSGSRFLQASLAAKIGAVPILRLNGIAVKDGGKARANNIQVLGIDSRFRSLLPSAAAPAFTYPAEGEAVINRQLADRLDLVPGDSILLKIEEAASLPRELPLLRDEQQTRNLTVTIKAIAGADTLGNFSLQANQAVPLTVFLPLSQLGERINLLLLPGQPESGTAFWQDVLQKNMTLPDTDLSLAVSPDGTYLTLFSGQIFIQDKPGVAARAADPGAEASLTYFANSLRSRDHSTPYSFISGLDQPLQGIPLEANDIIICDWLADDLDAGIGATINLSYYVQGSTASLEEREAAFTVKAILPLQQMMGMKSLVPAFPGLTEAANCRDWKPGIPLDLKQIRSKDELYWDQYRQTPKAYINLETARALWANRYGNLTAVRYPYTPDRAAVIPGKIMQALTPGDLGITVKPVLADGLEAGRRGINFGSLFLGLSMFLIGAALLLAGLFFQFSTEHSASEMGLLLALGFRQAQVQFMLFARGLIIAVTGAAAGIVPGILYTYAVLYGLQTVWNGAIGTSYLTINLRGETLAAGFGLTTLVSSLVLWVVIRKTAVRPVMTLLRSTGQYEQPHPPRKFPLSLAGALLCFLALAILIILAVLVPQHEPAALFFTAGTLGLAGCLCACHAFLVAPDRNQLSGHRLSLLRLGFRNLKRKRKRTLLTVGLLAGSIFTIVSVGANKKNLPGDIYARNAPTGGYRFFIETSLPFYDAGKIALSIPGSEILPVRVQPGEDASCLNLNYVRQPRLLGLDPSLPAARGSFSFSGKPLIPTNGNPWLLLNTQPAADVLYGFIDQTVLTWSLGKSLGETLSYTDAGGKEFKVMLIAALADTLFQGSIIISEQAFLTRYPLHNGYNLLLADAPPAKAALTEEVLSRDLQTLGPDVQAAGAKIAAFNEVENTYLLIYLMLGGLGLVIGTIGFAVVVLRKIAEMQNELAILKAMGYSFRHLLLYILAENWLLLIIGALCGIFASGIALIPVLGVDNTPFPVIFTFFLILGILVNGLCWLVLTAATSLQGNLLAGLRRE